LTNPQWEIRRAAFAKLIGLNPETYVERGVSYIPGLLKSTLSKEPENSEARKIELIELLDIENRNVEREDHLSEAYVNYYGDIIAAVSTLSDPRSIDVLVGAISTGNMATQTLISFGNIAVGPVAKKLDSQDARVRAAVSMTLSQMLERSAEISGNPAAKATIKTALVRATKDDDPFVRINALEGLVALGDAESLAIVDRLARDDPYRADYPGKEGKFLVRDAAGNALKRRTR
jgi:HEAT repeat protein